MTNAEFQEKLKRLTKEYLPIASKQMTINELVFVLRHDNDVPDYCLNISNASLGFSFGMLKEAFFPTKYLALKITLLEYEEDEDSECPILVVDTESKDDEWFGVVRWCRDDIISALTDKGYPVTENNINKLESLCKHHWFSDHMIEAGWDYINFNIGNGKGWDKPPKEE